MFFKIHAQSVTSYCDRRCSITWASGSRRFFVSISIFLWLCAGYFIV